MSIRKKFLRTITNNYHQQQQKEQQKEQQKDGSNKNTTSVRKQSKCPATNTGNALLSRTWKIRVC